MTGEPSTIVTLSVARQIAENLRQAILSGRLQINERLPTEDELAQQFGVSRPTIREALKRLAAEHLIQSRRGPSGGNFVKRPSIPELVSSLSNSMRLLATVGEFDLEDILEARVELEKISCRLAAERADPGCIESMRAEIALQRRADTSDAEFCASDVRFHQLLVQSTNNSLLEFLMMAMNEAFQPVTNFMVFRFRERTVIAKQHDRLLAALEIRDADAAVTAISDQMDYLRRKYKEARSSSRKKSKRT